MAMDDEVVRLSCHYMTSAIPSGFVRELRYYEEEGQFDPLLSLPDRAQVDTVLGRTPKGFRAFTMLRERYGQSKGVAYYKGRYQKLYDKQSFSLCVSFPQPIFHAADRVDTRPLSREAEQFYRRIEQTLRCAQMAKPITCFSLYAKSPTRRKIP